MTRSDRMQLIASIEEERGSRLIVEIWGDRQGHETVIANDAHSVFFRLLEDIGKVQKIDLLLYTTGGHTLAAWGLANLLREYCDHFGVLIPHRAYSSGTLLTLAADEIVMSRLGQLSPIDPSITTPLGPTVQLPAQPGQNRIVPISVEDVIGFIELAKSAAGLSEPASLLPIFERLTAQVHPLALGAVYRSREQIVTLADRLLSFHYPGDANREERQRIVEILTRGLGSHDYVIGRSEAQNHLKLNVVDAPQPVDQAMLSLFEGYASLLELRVPYNPEGFLQGHSKRSGNFNRAVIETSGETYVFRTSKEIQRIQVQQPGLPVPVSGVQEIISFEGWLNDDSV